MRLEDRIPRLVFRSTEPGSLAVLEKCGWPRRNTPCQSRTPRGRSGLASAGVIRERRERQLCPGFHPHSARAFPVEWLKETITIGTPLRFSPKLRPRRSQQPGKMHARPIRTLGTPSAWPILRRSISHPKKPPCVRPRHGRPVAVAFAAFGGATRKVVLCH